MYSAFRADEPMMLREIGGSHHAYASWIVPSRKQAEGLRVREDASSYTAYESEGSERRALASIPVAPDAHWTATLTVPIGGGDIAFLQLERQGKLPAGYRGADESVLLSLPIGEVDALVQLLGGVIAQARRDGVLPVE